MSVLPFTRRWILLHALKSKILAPHRLTGDFTCDFSRGWKSINSLWSLWEPYQELLWEPGEFQKSTGFQTQSLGLCCNSCAHLVTARWWCLCSVMRTVQSFSIVWTELSCILSRVRTTLRQPYSACAASWEGLCLFLSAQSYARAGRAGGTVCLSLSHLQCAMPMYVCMPKSTLVSAT